MSAATDNMNDPLAIFGEVAPTHESTEQEHSESSGSHVSNPFDPLGSSQSNLSQQQSSTSDAPLDIMSQISSWGAENHHQEEGEKATQEETKPEPPVSPTTKANVMVTKSDAIELSDDLVAEAHREFEATEDKLRKFEEQEQLKQ